MAEQRPLNADPAPPSPRPDFPRSNSSFSNLMTLTSLDRVGEEWAGASTLLDVIETFFDSRLDLFERRLKAQSNRLKNRAVELIPKGLRTPGGGGILLLDDDLDDAGEGGEGLGGGSGAGDSHRRKSKGEKYREDVEKEVDRIKVKLAAKVTHLSGTWRSAQVVRTKDKVSFLFGVLSLAFACLLFGMAPEWFPVAYTIQSAFYLPIRIYTYKKKAFHYFLFGDLCYFVNVIDLLWIWAFPSSTFMFICCYLLTLGPLASAIITWRNSLVFHSFDKVTSLFIHIYPPTVLTIIRHIYPNAEERYPGLKGVQDYSAMWMILFAGVPYVLWQGAYYKFISIDRKSKIESGQRQNSFHYMLNDKRGPIGKALKNIRPEHRELWFIFGQLIYSIIFMLPPALIFIHSLTASNIFLIMIFIVSAWNGATFYVEVFGRKFERELEKLRKEMEMASQTLTPSNSASSPFAPRSEAGGGADGEGEGEHASPSSTYTYATMSPAPGIQHRDQVREAGERDDLANSPLALPGAKKRDDEMEAPDVMMLERAVEDVDTDHGGVGKVRQRQVKLP